LEFNPVAAQPSEALESEALESGIRRELFERREFLPPPRYRALRGEPKAKLLGAFSLVRFFGASKEMNISSLNAADGRFSTDC
jgi:hypothetical protein